MDRNRDGYDPIDALRVLDRKFADLIATVFLEYSGSARG